MKRLSIAITGFSLLLLGACSSEAVRTTEAKNDVKEVIKVNTEDGGNVKVWTLGEENYTEKKSTADTAAPLVSDRDAYLARMENALRELGDRVEGLRNRADMRAKYTTGKNRLRHNVNRLESEIGDARRDLGTLRTESDAGFQRDRSRLDSKVAGVRAHLDRAAE